jgi:hypothetical protein
MINPQALAMLLGQQQNAGVGAMGAGMRPPMMGASTGTPGGIAPPMPQGAVPGAFSPVPQLPAPVSAAGAGAAPHPSIPSPQQPPNMLAQMGGMAGVADFLRQLGIHPGEQLSPEDQEALFGPLGAFTAQGMGIGVVGDS